MNRLHANSDAGHSSHVRGAGSVLQWGIIGTGSIARTFAQGLAGSHTGKLVAVGSRTQASADAFGDAMGVGRRHGSYDALLADADVQAVYISTPHPQHAQWAVAAARARKHVLCEKPIGMNAAEATAIIDAAGANDVFLAEAFMYRLHAQTQAVVRAVRDGTIGQVRTIQATFSFHAAVPPTSRLLSRDLGGGGILDVGCYPVSMARLIAGVALGRDFAEPVEVSGSAHLGETRVDEWAAAILTFEQGILAQLATGVQVHQDNAVRIYGSEGWIHVPTPWAPARDGGDWRFFVHRNGHDPASSRREIGGHEPRMLYTVEADAVAAYVGQRQLAPPGMTWADTLGNMKTLDRWREAVGLKYDCDR